MGRPPVKRWPGRALVKGSMAAHDKTSSALKASAISAPPSEQPDAATAYPEAAPEPRNYAYRGSLVWKLNYFWLAVIVAILVGGNVAASGHYRDLWSSWRGTVMIVLSLTMVGWYLALVTGSLQRGRPWPLPRRVWRIWLGSGFAITGGLLALDQGFVGLTYALIGCSLVVPLRESWLPVSVAIAMSGWGQGISLPSGAGHSWGDTLGSVGNIALSLGIVFAFSALFRERLQREMLFRQLSRTHQQLRATAALEADMATLRERNRLAREMHDSLGHALVSIAIKLEAARLLNAVDTSRANTELEETAALVRSTMTDLRHSLAGMRPAVLEEQSLNVALANLAHEMGRRTGTKVACLVDEDAARDRCLQETLFRVGQEALTNVAKHARARNATISLTNRDGAVILEVSDDGIGLGAAKNGGTARFGVRGMRERVEAAGGMLTLGPGPVGGTVLRARIPTVGGKS
jgi:signal transduction histidine kinase